jgi:hypothetical protein
VRFDDPVPDASLAECSDESRRVAIFLKPAQITVTV